MSTHTRSISPETVLNDEDSSSSLKTAAKKSFEIRRDDEIVIVEVDSFVVTERFEP